MVHGVALVSACYTTSSGEHYVQFGGHCVLARPIEVGSCLRNNGTYSLQDDLEVATRNSPTNEGGIPQRAVQGVRCRAVAVLASS